MIKIAGSDGIRIVEVKTEAKRLFKKVGPSGKYPLISDENADVELDDLSTRTSFKDLSHREMDGKYYNNLYGGGELNGIVKEKDIKSIVGFHNRLGGFGERPSLVSGRELISGYVNPRLNMLGSAKDMVNKVNAKQDKKSLLEIKKDKYYGVSLL